MNKPTIYIIWVVSIIFCLGQNLQSQGKIVTKEQPTNKKKTNRSPITATTKDGKIVLLKPNGTWEFTGDSVVVAPPISESVNAALKALRKFSGATNVGISFPEYSSRLIDLKSTVEESLIEINDGELKTNIKSALDAFTDASTLWNETLRTNYRIDADYYSTRERKIAILNYKEGNSPLSVYPKLEHFKNKYNIPINISNDEPHLDRTEALNIIWKVANTATENATRLSK